MPERNVDKIERLQQEAKRWEYLANQKSREAEAFKKELDKYQSATSEIQQAVDSVLITVTVMHGEKQDNGNYILSLPRSRDGETLKAFKLKIAGFSTDESEVVLEAIKIENEVRKEIEE